MTDAFTLHHGDCLDVLRGMPDASVDAVVTDPPYGLSFMGKRWDYDVPSVAVWSECLRVLKPGGHLLSFGGSRTYHRMAVNVEDAGFEIRDQVMWVYGSGFPKSHNISKAIDKAAGAEREVVGVHKRHGGGNAKSGSMSGDLGTESELPLTAPATDAAKQWHGWGSALKPAHEPIVLARKPLGEKTLAANVLKHGTGAINIDGCRVESGDENLNGGAYASSSLKEKADSSSFFMGNLGAKNFTPPKGRFPANLIHDGSDEVVAGFPDSNGQQGKCEDAQRSQANTYGSPSDNGKQYEPRNDKGSASRFFYCAKASKKDRDEGLQEFEAKASAASEFRPNHAEKASKGEDGNPYGRWKPQRNIHPTVKPTTLMAYLCRLITPPGGTVLDPFMGSGSTGKGAVREGFNFIGIEREAEYIEIARARIEAANV